MELKQFISKTIHDVVNAVDETSSELNREVKINSTNDTRSIEFDIAVIVEESEQDSTGKSKGFGGKIKIASLEIGGGKGKEVKKEAAIRKEHVSKISFGVNVSTWEKDGKPQPFTPNR